MKTLTTLTAVAALVAGISIASAQNKAGPAPQDASPSNLNKGSSAPSPGSAQSGSQAKGTANKAANTKNQIVTGTGKFCMTGAPGGTNSLECKYASMQACETAAKSQERECQENPKMTTTGSSSMKNSGAMKKDMKK